MSLNPNDNRPNRYGMPSLNHVKAGKPIKPNLDHRMWELRDEILAINNILESIQIESCTFIVDPDILSGVDEAWSILSAMQSQLCSRLNQIEVLCYGSPQPAILENSDTYIHREMPRLHSKRFGGDAAELPSGGAQ